MKTMEAKHLIVENGVLKVTDKQMPSKPEVPKGKTYTTLMFSDECKTWRDDVDAYKAALESWKQEALPVVNTIWLYNNLLILHDKGVDLDAGLCAKTDGIYDAPAGLEYEVIGNPTMIGDCKYELANEEKFAILSFASPKEETPNCNHNFVTRVDGRMVCSFCGAIGYIDFASTEETHASKEKPDFEKMAKQFVGRHVRPGKGYIGEVIFENMLPSIVEHTKRTMEFIYKAEVVPYQEQIAALQEEIRQLKNKQ